MTTITGMKNKNPDTHLVLGSDESQTMFNYISQGDVTHNIKTKQAGQKIYVDEKGEFAVAMAGIFDPQFSNFLTQLLQGKINLKAAIEKNFLEEVVALNAGRADYKNLQDTNELVFATRFEGQPQIYRCYPLGRIESTNFTTIGSGANFAGSYVGSQMPRIPPNLTLEEAIDLTNGALTAAAKDIYTSGIDIVIVTPDRITAYGPIIKAAMDKARADAIKDIKRDVANRKI